MRRLACIDLQCQPARSIDRAELFVGRDASLLVRRAPVYAGDSISFATTSFFTCARPGPSAPVRRRLFLCHPSVYLRARNDVVRVRGRSAGPADRPIDTSCRRMYVRRARHAPLPGICSMARRWRRQWRRSRSQPRLPRGSLPSSAARLIIFSAGAPNSPLSRFSQSAPGRRMWHSSAKPRPPPTVPCIRSASPVPISAWFETRGSLHLPGPPVC